MKDTELTLSIDDKYKEHLEALAKLDPIVSATKLIKLITFEHLIRLKGFAPYKDTEVPEEIKKTIYNPFKSIPIFLGKDLGSTKISIIKPHWVKDDTKKLELYKNTSTLASCIARGAIDNPSIDKKLIHSNVIAILNKVREENKGTRIWFNHVQEDSGKITIYLTFTYYDELSNKYARLGARILSI